MFSRLMSDANWSGMESFAGQASFSATLPLRALPGLKPAIDGQRSGLRGESRYPLRT